MVMKYADNIVKVKSNSITFCHIDSFSFSMHLYDVLEPSEVHRIHTYGSFFLYRNSHIWIIVYGGFGI